MNPRRWFAIVLIASLGATLAIAAVSSSSAPRRTIALDASVFGQGAITDATGRIDCGERCDAKYARDAIVEVTAVPGPNETFERWGGDCFGESPACGLLLDRPARVRAVFRPIAREVRITVGGPGTITSQPAGLRCGTAAADCSGTFGQGQTIRLIADADADAALSSWGRACEGEPATGCNLTVGANAFAANQALATFKDAAPAATGPQPLTVTAEHGARVLSSPAAIDCGTLCVAPFEPGTAVTLSSHSYWTGACVGAAPSCTVVVDKPLSLAARGRVSAVSAVSGYGITVNIQGRSGRVTSGRDIRCDRTKGTALDCKHTFDKGRRVKLRATPARRSRFAGWTRACAKYKRQPVCEVNVTSAKSTTAFFRP